MVTRSWVQVMGVAVSVVCLFGRETPSLRSAWAAEDADKALAAKVDRLFAQWDKPDSPGCALGIIRDGKLIIARGYGMANLDDSVSITPRTVFEVGSVTKSFTCACIALLLDQGKIAADDDIRKYLPELPRYDAPITIRHLIRCECGLPDYFHLMQLAGWNIDDAYTNEDVLALLMRWKTLPFKPGEKFAYTSSGYFLLGALVQRVTGQSLARFAEENLFTPLGMTSTYYDDNPTRVVKHRAVGYNVASDGGIRRWMMHSNTVGGWGLKSTVEDLARWNDNFSRNKLPEGKHISELLEQGTLLGNRNVLDADPRGAYRGLRRIQFTGGMPGFAAALVRFPEQGFTVICLSNDNWRASPWGLASQIADLYLEGQFKEPAKKKETDAKTFKRIEQVEPTHEQLAQYAGSYHNEDLQTWYHFLENEGRLYLRVNNRRLERLTPRDKDVFTPYRQTADDNRIITFRRDAKDRVKGLSIDLWRVKNVHFQKRP